MNNKYQIVTVNIISRKSRQNQTFEFTRYQSHSEVLRIGNYQKHTEY